MEFLKNIYYINLERRTDRRAQIEDELCKMGLTGTRFIACDINPGIVGCGKSHLEVLKLARLLDLEHVLIFEDDFTFLVNKYQLINEFESIRNMDFDVIMLGYNLIKEMNNADRLGKVLEAQTTSGYLVNKRYYTTLIECWEKGLQELIQTGRHWDYALDQVWKQLQYKDKWYYFITRIGKQRDGYSDNSNCFTVMNC